MPKSFAMRFLRFTCGVAALLAVLFGNAHADSSQPLTVFAAASTAGTLEEVASLYEAAGHARFRAVYASSGVLARQIANGAPADLYLSANATWMDWLAARGAVDGDPIPLLGNRLVLIQAVGTSPLSLDDTLPAALANGRLAMGDPDHVPAGIYARQALESMGLWPALSPLAVRMKDVRAALLLVQRGEAAAGIVYESDALGDERLQVAATFPDGSHDPIRYSVAVMKEGNRDAARRLLDFLRRPESAEVFRRHGFGLE